MHWLYVTKVNKDHKHPFINMRKVSRKAKRRNVRTKKRKLIIRLICEYFNTLGYFVCYFTCNNKRVAIKQFIDESRYILFTIYQYVFSSFIGFNWSARWQFALRCRWIFNERQKHEWKLNNNRYTLKYTTDIINMMIKKYWWKQFADEYFWISFVRN